MIDINTVRVVAGAVKIGKDNYTVTFEDGGVYDNISKSQLEMIRSFQNNNAIKSQEYIDKYKGQPEHIVTMFGRINRDEVIKANTTQKSKYDDAVVIIDSALSA